MTSAWQREALLRAPLFAPLHPVISRLGDDFPSLLELNRLLSLAQHKITVQSGQALRFVPQETGKLAFESQYEPRCYLNGEVQSRSDNWHDLLNALVWITFPKAKAAINSRHYQALLQHHELSGSSQRGAVRDTNTLMDESGVIIACADPQLAQALRDFQWRELFWRRRKDVQAQMGFYLFGHGLYEKALQPYIGLTGQGIIFDVEAGFFAWPQALQLAHLDERLAAYWSDVRNCRDTRELSPLPLLGVPGWYAGNEAASFYDDTQYFRPGRRTAA